MQQDQTDSKVNSPLIDVASSVRLACEYGAARCQQHLTLTDLAQATQLPSSTLGRYFKQTYGTSPMRWLWAFRTLLAAELIALYPTWSLQLISQECGFTSQAHFSRRFHSLFRSTPSHFREQLLHLGTMSRPKTSQPPMARMQRERLLQYTLTRLATENQVISALSNCKRP